MTRRKVTDLDVPLFDNLPAVQGSSREQATPQRSVEFGRCPHHAGGGVTGLVRGGRHLYWRAHFVRTYGSRRLCIASEAPLCSAPAKGIHQPLCPCGGRGDTNQPTTD
jgi:hypothetical protein